MKRIYFYIIFSYIIVSSFFLGSLLCAYIRGNWNSRIDYVCDWIYESGQENNITIESLDKRIGDIEALIHGKSKQSNKLLKCLHKMIEKRYSKEESKNERQAK